MEPFLADVARGAIVIMIVSFLLGQYYSFSRERNYKLNFDREDQSPDSPFQVREDKLIAKANGFSFTAKLCFVVTLLCFFVIADWG